ncbi:MAG TPA: hypothetical protein VGG30_13080 [Pirellulales bacterium]|jgi:hypothetical protein
MQWPGPISRGFLLLAALVIGAMAIGYRQAQNAAMLDSCNCRMCGMCSTLAQHYQVHGSFPPEYTQSADGKRSTWKQILEKFQKDEFDLSCPTKNAAFAAVCGPGAILDGEHATSPGEVADGCENTLILIEFTLPSLRWRARRKFKSTRWKNWRMATECFQPRRSIPAGADWSLPTA